MPPAASTRAGATASTTSGTSAIVGSVAKLCPPASRPWATTRSIPSSTARRAASGEPTCSHTLTPALCSASIHARGGCPQWNDTTGTCSAHATSICAGSVNVVMKLMLNGRSVPARTASIVAFSAGGGISPTPMDPSPPARHTATARSGVIPTNAMPAWAMGWLTPYVSVNRVRIMSRSSAAARRTRWT